MVYIFYSQKKKLAKTIDPEVDHTNAEIHYVTLDNNVNFGQNQTQYITVRIFLTNKNRIEKYNLIFFLNFLKLGQQVQQPQTVKFRLILNNIFRQKVIPNKL